MGSLRPFVLYAIALLSACASTPDTPLPGPVLPSVTDTGSNYNRLHAYVRLKRPDPIKTLGDAARYCLDTTGYTLVMPPAVEHQIALAESSRQIVTIETAIVQLLGNAYRLHVDHDHKHVTVESMPAGAVQNHVTTVTDGVHTHESATNFGTF